MFSSRKPLAIALTLVIMLAMLVPAAMAAPAWGHGIAIDKVAPNALGSGNTVKVDYTITFVGTQVYDVYITAWLESPYKPGTMIATNTDHLQALWLQTHKSKSINLTVPNPTINGWYDVYVCALDNDGEPPLHGDPGFVDFCAKQPQAVLVDDVKPVVNLVSPKLGYGGHDNHHECNGIVWVTGKELLVGTAVDTWGVAKTWFSYRANENDDFVPLGDGVATPGVANQYEFLWDSTAVPDSSGEIQFCAKDKAGNQRCDEQLIQVENRYTVDLKVGWNLISSPLLPYDPAIESVLFHLIQHGSVKQVIGMNRVGPGYAWPRWTAAPGDPEDLTEIVDGKGYWIEMAAPDALTIVGTWSTIGGMAPPQYGVVDGWNLIGYTHWGEPTSAFCYDDKLVLDYLGVPLSPSVEALWRYNAANNTYIPTDWLDEMTKGAGYWLATAAPGTINP
jgi:hypothetical protein